MTRQTTPQMSLDNLKKEAKRRLKALHSDLLAPRSRDVWNLVFTGQVARLREVLEEKTDAEPLFWLPDVEWRAVKIARRRGMNDAAERLEAGAR